jgi:hypothetical protein
MVFDIHVGFSIKQERTSGMKKTPKDGGDALDFSEEAVRKDAFAETLQHPLTLWPSALGVAGAVAVGLFTSVSAPFLGLIVLGGVGFGAGNWAYRFFGGKDAYMREHYERLHEQFEKMKERKLATLGTDLKKLKCKRGYEQVAEFEEKFQNLLTVLERVLSVTEMTFGRYKVTAEQVYNSGLENLDRIVIILTNMDDVDRDDLGERIETLQTIKIRRSSDEITLKALLDRARLFDESVDEVENLLAQNEQALTAIDAAGRAATSIRGTKSAEASGNLDSAMEELMGLTKRAAGAVSSIKALAL